MDNLRKAIKLFFEGLDPDKILKQHLWNNHKELIGLDYVNEEQTFQSLAYGWATFDQQSTDEIHNLHQKIQEDWGYNPYIDKTDSNARFSPFHLLNHFTKQVLVEVESEPYVNYHHFLKWRDVSMRLGEDLLAASYLAQQDVIARKDRFYFSWRPTLFTDNRRLHSMLQKGVAENHSHLWASSLTFDLSWLALMNDYGNLRQKVAELSIKQALAGKKNPQLNTEKVEFKVLIEKAITLRLVLYLSMGYLKNIKDGIKNKTVSVKEHISSYFEDSEFSLNDLHQPSNTVDSSKLVMNMNEILKKINEIKYLDALELPFDGGKKAFDYAVPKNLMPDNFHGCYFLYGERKILYYYCRMIYTDVVSKSDKIYLEELLLAYLNIKGIFRREIVQLNDRYGFGNFKDYQDRKMDFIPNKSIYHTIFLDITLNFNRKLMNILSNEYRISPGESANDLKQTIEQVLRTRQYDDNELDWERQLLGRTDLIKYIEEAEIRKTYTGKELFFVIHFFKEKDNFQQHKKEKLEKKILQKIQSRDSKLRKRVKNQAYNIREVREKHPTIAQYIRGIDAASSEVFARPEVFAQAFRFLKHHQNRKEEHDVKRYLFDSTEEDSDRLRPSSSNNQLRITFHAGEDFYDVVDGMRYIDECIRFLGMTHGDRFGHALAIGIDVSQYYQLKEHKIMLTKHTLLDNIAWILSKVRKFGLTQHLNEVYRLENIFKKLYSNIYLNHINNESVRHVHYQQFYDAWKLRGDNPKLYYDYFEKLVKRNTSDKSKYSFSDFINDNSNITYWERCSLNDTYVELNNLRNREEIARLYFEYHFNSKVKNTGNEIKQFEITPTYVNLVQDVQKCMMQFVVQRNLYIETNPTSNYLIGPIEKYSEHPIRRWFNLGLETDVQKIQESPQISVSINTDDAGIFSTTMENEYALMAIALEKEKDENGQPLYKPAMIYDWLDRIREMGLEQSFIDKNQFKK